MNAPAVGNLGQMQIGNHHLQLAGPKTLVEAEHLVNTEASSAPPRHDPARKVCNHRCPLTARPASRSGGYGHRGGLPCPHARNAGVRGTGEQRKPAISRLDSVTRLADPSLPRRG
jgi:hypothetical protein